MQRNFVEAPEYTAKTDTLAGLCLPDEDYINPTLDLFNKPSSSITSSSSSSFSQSQRVDLGTVLLLTQLLRPFNISFHAASWNYPQC